MAAAYNMGFRELTQVQKLSLPLLCADPPQNVTVQAHSGSGKTAAMALFMLNRIDPREKYSQAIFVTFTLELAVQLNETIRQFAQYIPELRVRMVVPGQDSMYIV